MGALTPISIIVPARDAAPTLQQCLAALLQLPPSFARIVVVDDGSRDGTGTIARQLGVEVLTLAQSIGPAAARNAGVAATASDIMVFIDADVVASPDAVRRLVAPLLGDEPRDPAVVATFGSYDAHPGASGTVSTFRNLLHHATHQEAQEQSTSFWAGFGAITRTAFVALGGFDAQRFPRPSIEDIELGARLWRAGARVRLVKLAQVTHLKHWTLGSMVRTDVRDRAWPWATLLLSGDAPARDLNISARQRWAALAAVTLAVAIVLLVGNALIAVGGQRPIARPAALLTTTIAAVSLGALLTLNHPLYRFFLRERGWAFAVAALALHVLYYLYSTATYVACALRLRGRMAWRHARPGAA